MKMFLLASEFNREEVGDVIVDLDVVSNIRVQKKNDSYILALDIPEGMAVARFSTEAKLRDELRNILSIMSQDTSFADKILVCEKPNKESELVQALDALKKAVA